MTKRFRHAHPLVAKVAREIVGAMYAPLMQDNALYDLWKKQNPGCTSKQLEERFIAKNWGKGVEGARATLATMLSRPIDNREKEIIHEALVLDASLRMGRGPRGPVVGQQGITRQR